MGGAADMMMMQMMMNANQHKMSRGSHYRRRRPSVSKYDKRIIRDAKRTRRKWPRKDYARAFIPRGTEGSLNTFGPSWATANAEQQAYRKAMGFRGRGLYVGDGAYGAGGIYQGQGGFFGDVGNWFKGAGRTIGRGISTGAKWGWKHRKELADLAAEGARAYEGMGDYSTSNELMIGGGKHPAVMTGTTNSESGSIRVSQTEYVQDIFAPYVSGDNPSGFNTQRIAVNAGLQNFAPNLSQIAVNFSEYEIHQLVFELRPVLSENNVNNGQSGVAMMAFDYDNKKVSPFDSKEEVMQAFGSASGRVVEKITCGIECDPDQSRNADFKIRSSPVKLGQTIDEYDKGILTIATNNIPQAFSNQQLFELWVYYTVDLRKRRSGALKVANQQSDLFTTEDNDAGISSITSAIWSPNKWLAKTIVDSLLIGQQNNIGGSWATGAADATLLTFNSIVNPLGTAPTNLLGGNFALTPVVPGLGDILYVFPPNASGLYHMNIRFSYSGDLLQTPQIGATGFGNIVAVSDMYNTFSTVNGPAAVSWDLGASNWNFSFDLHVKLQSVTGGQNNGVYFSILLTQTLPLTTTTLLGVTLTVSENTQKEFQSLTNFTPQFLDPLTEVPVLP